ncbi:uncharacterized protein [Arachis hypogaea]|uniref:uncharacterized protein n=1 Tax=Arachis hypogaea TaxID=3818 RepID=UPI003B224812
MDCANIIAWNVRGARNKLARVHLKQLVKNFYPYVFIILETHCAFQKVAVFWNRLGYTPIHIEEAQGNSGGIWVLSAWPGVSCNIVAASLQVVCVEFSNGGFSWVCAAIYASPVPSMREEAWSVFTDFSKIYSGPLLAIGNFNEILLSSEVKGGNFVSRRVERFGALLDECGLIDVGAHGSLYTWFRHMQGNRFISKRLDRAVATDAWCFRFSESYVENLARMHSDHCPIMVRCQGNDRRVGVKPFRFQVAWSYHPNFSSVVSGAWDKGRPNPIRCLSQVRDDALAFNRDVFGNTFKRKRELERRVTSIQQRMERVDALSLIQEERELQSEYSNLLMQEELFWYQKSREHWVRFRDRNTKFFHMQTIMRRKRNKVQGLFLEDGRWSTDPQELEECAIGFYRDLFCNVEQIELDVMGDQELPSLSCEAIESITRNVSKKEVRKVVMGMNSFKAPRADGFQAFFFKEYWEVVGTTGGFIPERGAPDNIIIAQEVLHFMKKTKSKKGVLAFKIDLEKAYDRPKRGLRQGDPMSPYLFVICMERLSCLIARQVEVGRWKPVTMSRGGSVISHLLFADDLIFFCKAKKSQVLHVLDTIATFCRAFGIKVNFDKSRAICSMNVSRQHKDLFTGISSIRFANSLGKYLGVPLKHGIVTKADFNDVFDKLTNRLASWKCRFLNKAGRICLTKSVLSSIPIYRMQVSLFPSGVCSKIDKFTRSFIWCGSHNHRGLHLASWRVLTTPKKFGGLALQESRLVNFSLLGKLVWQILMNQEKLWVKIMLQKYLQNRNLFAVKAMGSSSYIWKSIVHTASDCEVVRSVWVSLGFSDVCFFGSHEGVFGSDHLMGQLHTRLAGAWWILNIQLRIECCIQGLKPLSWSPPEPGAWKLNCDGSVNLGDDCAGFGWVIRDSSSQWVMGCSENSFGPSVIKMELWSIWKGLTWAWEAGLKLVVCETDCAATFELVTGWQVPLWHLEKEVIQLIFDLKLRRDWDIRFELIPREANVVADRLAKMGSGGSETDEVHLWHQPLEVVCPFLLLRT